MNIDNKTVTAPMEEGIEKRRARGLRHVTARVGKPTRFTSFQSKDEGIIVCWVRVNLGP